MAATAEQKGNYALYMLLLFKAHRTPDDLWDYIFGVKQAKNSLDEAYHCIYAKFLQWRNELECCSARFRSRQHHEVDALP
eukprot:12027091-Karenia_brevis.AAC.1